MNKVPGHFIYREMAIGCCTELLEYTEIVMSILYFHFINVHFMNEAPGHFIYREMAIGCFTELLKYTEIVMAILYCYLSK